MDHGPCVPVWAGYGARGTATASSGLCGRRCSAWVGTGWVQAQLPHQGLSCRWGLGLPLKREGGVSWLPGGCTPQLSPCSTTHSSVLEPVISHAPPKQVLTPVVDTPQPHIGVPTPPLEPPAVLLLWLQLPPSHPGEDEEPRSGSTEQCGQGEPCLNTLRHQSQSHRAPGKHQLQTHPWNARSCCGSSP